MPGLPIAGADSTVGNPFEYGKFQSFLPDLAPEGRNPMATGLRPEMLQYEAPSGDMQQSSSSDAAVQVLRDELARALARPAAAPPQAGGPSAMLGDYNPARGGG
jgi:hypothetical protein